MDRLMPFDELNVLSGKIREIYATGTQEQEREGILDSVLDLLILSYLYGNEAANTMLGTEEAVDTERLDRAVTEEIAGETWIQRINKYITSGTAEDVIRVVETDSHRIYNEAIYEVGEKVSDRVSDEESSPVGAKAILPGPNGSSVPARPKGVVYKEWECMMLPTSRDTHVFLNGTKVPFEEAFYTYDGDFAMRPGDFLFPENNINCLCRLRLSREK